MRVQATYLTHLSEPQGERPYKNDEGARRKIPKTLLNDTRISICARSSEHFDD